MSDRWSRLAPLTGVAFAVLTVAAVFAKATSAIGTPATQPA
jgi:hypothetical protein